MHGYSQLLHRPPSKHRYHLHYPPMSSRTIRRGPAEGHLGSRRPLCVLPLMHSHRQIRLEWCRSRGYWIAAEWKQVVFSDESRFNFISDDNRVRVRRPRDK
ncbi:UNVERIFIED_CONTAM: hypothetical protein NCL1_07325 [Trichonephila clavipes]